MSLDFTSFDALPRDVLWLLMTRYFDPVDAVRCLRVCKRLNQCVAHDVVRVRVIKAVAGGRFDISPRALCLDCNKVVHTSMLRSHLRTHKRHPDRFPVLPVGRSKCELCDVSFPSDSHASHCLMEIMGCCDHVIGQRRCNFTGWRLMVR